MWRGNKYECEVLEIEVNDCKSHEVYIESRNDHNGETCDKKFSYKLHFDLSTMIKKPLSEFIINNVNFKKVTITRECDEIDEKSLKDYLDIIHLYSEGTQQFLKDKYEKVVRNK
jgi:hypothetical protein